MKDTRLGFIPIIRTTFDVPFAVEVTDQVRAWLTRSGFTVLEPRDRVTNLEEAATAANQLADNPPDLLLVLQATFADSTMVTTLAEQVDAPLLLWGVPEPHTGGRLRLNSLCGINLAGHALTRAGKRYGYVYGAPDDPAALDKVLSYARAARVRRALHGARIGRIGENPAGFETCLFDAARLQEQLGVEVVQVDLQRQVFDVARTAEPAAVQATLRQLAERVEGLDTVDAEATRGTLSAYVTLRQLAYRKRLNGMAVRCWPEFFTEMGCAACGAVSLLTDERTPSSCEADVNGTITQFMLQTLSGEPAFGSDIVSVDAEADALVLWHCGLAPLSMADPEEHPGVTIHSNRKMPLLMEFALKPGRVTVARLNQTADGYRLVVGGGEVIRAPRAFSGTSGMVRFDRPATYILDTILTEGLEHHIALTYGDHVQALIALAQMLDLPVLRL